MVWLDVLLLLARATGAVFIFSGVSKLMSWDAFLAVLRSLPFLPSWTVTLVVMVLPWVEISLGSMLIIGLWTLYATWMSLTLLLIFSLVAITAVARGLDVPCSCFGAASQAPLSTKTIIRNALLALLLLPLLLIHHPSPTSIDALLGSSYARSSANVLLILLVPACVAGVSALIATAQHTLAKMSAH